MAVLLIERRNPRKSDSPNGLPTRAAVRNPMRNCQANLESAANDEVAFDA